MKALVYTAPHELTWRDEPEPELGAGDVLVRVEAAGICGSDMHAFHGADARRVPPLVLGHEVAGIVESGALAGTRVVVNPLITCGTCDVCLDGRTNLCAQRQLIGMNRPGAFAERLAIPERNLVVLPAGMDPVVASLTEPAAVALHAVRLAARSAPRPLAEGRALVLGAGAIGLLSGLMLAQAGVHEVAVGDPNPLRRDNARRAGVLRAYDPLEAAPPAARYDVVIDAVGSAATRDAALTAVKAGGTVVHVGLHDSSGSLDVRRMTLEEITFVGTYTYTFVDVRAAVAALHRGLPGGFDWIDRRALRDGQGAFDDLDGGRSAAAKIVLLPSA